MNVHEAPHRRYRTGLIQQARAISRMKSEKASRSPTSCCRRVDKTGRARRAGRGATSKTDKLTCLRSDYLHFSGSRRRQAECIHIFSKVLVCELYYIRRLDTENFVTADPHLFLSMLLFMCLDRHAFAMRKPAQPRLVQKGRCHNCHDT